MMKNNPNGINRLVLINSANYELAELPLDESVSLVGPNNSGTVPRCFCINTKLRT